MSYELKSNLLSSGKFKSYVKVRNYNFKLEQYGTLSYIDDLDLNVYDTLSDFEKKECERLYNAKIQRTIRLKKRIRYIFNNYEYVYFLTLTFNDKTLLLSSNTRRFYVKLFLNDITTCYIANIDYGKRTEREHFHAVISSNCPIKNINWLYGFYNIKLINKTELDSERIAKYISKLTNHAIKETTKFNKIMYSRNKIS